MSTSEKRGTIKYATTYVTEIKQEEKKEEESRGKKKRRKNYQLIMVATF